MTVNVWSDLLVGVGDYDTEDHARRNQELYRMLSGLTGWGRPALLTEYEGTDTANLLSSSDATNGIGLHGKSQNDLYQLEIRNSGMNITGAPTLAAFTEGSVLFIGTSKVLSEDNTNLFYTNSTDTLKAQNLVVPTKAAVGAASLGTQVLTVTGNAQVSTFLGVGGAPSATIQLLVTGTANITGDFTVATTKFTVAAATGNTLVAGTLDVTSDFKVNTTKFTVTASTGATVIAGNITHDTTLLTTDVTNDKVSIGAATATTDPMFSVAGTMRSVGVGAPTAGVGMELSYNTGTALASVLSYDRTGAAFKALALRGLTVDLKPSDTSKFFVDGTGIRFFAGGTGVAKQTVDGAVSSAGVDATYGNTERDLLIALASAVNSIRSAIIAYDLVA